MVLRGIVGSVSESRRGPKAVSTSSARVQRRWRSQSKSRWADPYVVLRTLATGWAYLFGLGVSGRVSISGEEVSVMQTRTTSYAVLSAGQGSPSVAGSAAMSGSTTKEVSVVESGSESESGLYPRSRSEAWSWSWFKSREESASGRWSESGSRSRVGSWGKSGSR